MTERQPDAPASLERTRSAVLNVLVAAGSGIAVSGLLLRWRDGWAEGRAPEGVALALFLALIGLVAVSSLLRRVGMSGGGDESPAARQEQVHRGHLRAAVVGALAVPLGLAYGWFVRPRLDAVAPFWVAALALGFLALPRSRALEVPPVPESEGVPAAEPGGRAL